MLLNMLCLSEQADNGCSAQITGCPALSQQMPLKLFTGACSGLAWKLQKSHVYMTHSLRQAQHISVTLVFLQVADVCVEALVEPAAANKVVEVIANPETTPLPMSQLFQGVMM